jgi:DNA relaxase NicK
MSKIIHDKTPWQDYRLNDILQKEFDELIKNNANGFFDPALLEKLDKVAADFSLPPSNNMGVSSSVTPLFFPQCEIPPVFGVQKTTIDWLGFSTFRDIEETLYGLQQIFPGMIRTAASCGMQGYPSAMALEIDNEQMGMIGYGAKHGRISVSLTGVCCKKLNTSGKIQFAYEVLALLEVRLSRIDICLDLFQGELTYEACLWAYEQGRFKKFGAHGMPQIKEVGARGARGENLGRTMYLGIREGELYTRIYEKGLEIFAKMTPEFKALSTERENLNVDENGKLKTIADDWLRLECEFKRKSKDRPLKLEMMLDRDNFFAGAYPYFADVIGLATGRGREALRNDGEIVYEKLLAAHRRAFGNHVFTMVDIGMTDAEIVASLNTGTPNKKLRKSGIAARMKRAHEEYTKNNPDAAIPF